MSLKLISAAASEPITLAELKAQCRVDTSDEDSVLAICIAGARDRCEQITGRAILTQLWEQGLDEFPEAEIELLRPPVASIVSVQYWDPLGVLRVVNSSLYTLDADTYPGWLLPAFDTDWPETQDQANAVLIQYLSGYGASGAAIPPSMKNWLLMTAAYLFEQREALVVDGKVIDVPSRFVDAMLDPFRIVKLW